MTGKVSPKRMLIFIPIVALLIGVTVFVWIEANPAPTPTYIPIPVSYPPQAGATFPGTGLVASFILQASGPISEGVDVTVRNATGEITGDTYSSAFSVRVGFQEAIPSSFRNILQNGGLYVGGLAGVEFQPKNYTGGIPIQIGNQTSLNLVPINEDTFYFPVAGDFSPTITIDLANAAPITYTYSDIRVHVLSATEVTSLHNDTINVALTVALLAFAYVEAIKLGYDYTHGQ